MDHLKTIVSKFCTEGVIKSVRPLGSGHINDSYLVETEAEYDTNYVLQRINHKIFTNVPELTGNILKVTGHIRKNLELLHPEYAHFQMISQLPAKSGGYYIQDANGNFWRLYNFVRGSKSHDVVGSQALASEGGKAFGLFQLLTSDMDASTLFEILPKFHHIGSRLDMFREILAKDPAGRAGEAAGEISFVEARAEEMFTIERLGSEGLLPLRVTHNDTKFNNILFNDRNEAISVVDLDTVMPGYVLYDFGDAIRTGANTAAEDEADLSKISIDLTLFDGYSKGYLSIARQFLTRTETDHLAFSTKFMTFIIGLRFLTDHLNGAQYYKTAFPGHNLQRARAQFRLLETMESHFQQMEEIIKRNS